MGNIYDKTKVDLTFNEQINHLNIGVFIMKKIIYFTILFILLLPMSCGKSPQEKLVGEWDVYGEGIINEPITFNSDGTFTAGDQRGTWKLEHVDSDTLILKIYEDGELEEENTINFKTIDELEVFDAGKNVAVLKRKVELVKRGKRRSDKAEFEGEWEANRSQLTITKNSTDTFLVSFNDGGFEAGTFIADLDGDVLVGRGGRFSGLILLLEDNGETLVVGEYRYNKINN